MTLTVLYTAQALGGHLSVEWNWFVILISSQLTKDQGGSTGWVCVYATDGRIIQSALICLSPLWFLAYLHSTPAVTYFLLFKKIGSLFSLRKFILAGNFIP